MGRNLCAQLKNILNGKARCYGDLSIEEVMEYDLGNTPEELDSYCAKADFVFHLAGVNRPKDAEEFMKGNFGFSSVLLETLQKHHNTCPVMLSSSAQASLSGRFGNSEYGRSKKAGEELFFNYSKGNGGKVLVYRFPNLYGKWCRPNYNSAVATFCHNIAHDLPVRVDDPAVELELLYIDDLVEEMICALQGREHRCHIEGLDCVPSAEGAYCYCPVTHKVTLGRIVELLHQFSTQREALAVPLLEDGFEKRLYSTYLSYLPKEKFSYPLKMNSDARGSFTEMLRTPDRGQVAINVSKPGFTKGQHWHHSKVEKFVVVSGHGLIRQRRIDSEEVIDFEVSGEKMVVVETIPGYTHNIVNLSASEDLITLIWCNECFDPNRPDTYFEEVEPK